MEKKEALLGRISINPEIMTGKPVISGTRLTVEYILDLLAEGVTIAEIMEEYDGLTPDDIFACLTFARQALSDITYMPMVSAGSRS